MRIFDQHLHCRYSSDCDAAPRDCVRSALDQGLAGLTFTDHFDTHPEEWPLCEYDYDALAEELAGLRDEFGEHLFIGHGIEVCYQPEQTDKILAYLEGRQFDLIILSVHWADGRALMWPSHWEGWEPAAATEAYLRRVLEAVRLAGRLRDRQGRVFDVLGHLDLVKRYSQRFCNHFDVRPYARLIDEILQACLEADLVPELNTSTLRQSLPEPMPADWVVRRYAELGGTAMSLGSDAHTPETVGAGLTEGVDLLRQQGIRHLALFRDRKQSNELL